MSRPTDRISDTLRERIEAANDGRDPRNPPSIDPGTGKLREMAKPVHGVMEAYNSMPYATRPGWLLTYHVRGERFERTYECIHQIEAMTQLSSDDPGAYDITCVHKEIPIET